MAEIPPAMAEFEFKAIEYNDNPPINSLLQSKELIKFYEMKRDKLLEIETPSGELYVLPEPEYSTLDNIQYEKNERTFEFNTTENNFKIDGFDRINCEKNVISGFLLPFKRDFSRQIFYDYTEKKYIKLEDLGNSDNYILNYFNNLFNKLYNTNNEPVSKDYSNIPCKCDKNLTCSLYKDLDMNDVHKLLLYNISFLSQATIETLPFILGRQQMNISNKITIFNKENKTLSIVALIKFEENIIGKIILCFDTSKIFKFARVLIEFNFNNENGSTNFMTNMETYISNIKNVTENVNIIRCLSSGNSKLDDNFKTVRESAGEQAHMKLLGTNGKPLPGTVGRDITHFHKKDCSGYYVPGHSTINKVKKGSKNTNIPLTRNKKGRETSYRGDDINICTQNKRLNFLYDTETAQLQDLRGISGDIIARQISNLYTDFKNTSFIMILVADTIAINKLCGKTISPLDFIEINGKRKNLYKKENNYEIPNELFTADKFNIEDYQYIYIINEPEFSAIPGVLDPPISIVGIKDLNNTVLAIKNLYLDVDRTIPMIIVSSYLSRSILTATIIGKEMQTYIDPNTRGVFFENKYNNIAYICDLYMYICIIRNLIIEYINIGKIGGDFFNEIYHSEIVDSYYSDNVKNFRSKIVPEYLFDKQMKSEDLVINLGFDISNYKSRKSTLKLTNNGSQKGPRKGSRLGSFFGRKTKKASSVSGASGASGANGVNADDDFVVLKTPEEEEAEEEERLQREAKEYILQVEQREAYEKAQRAHQEENAIRARLEKADQDEIARIATAEQKAKDNRVRFEKQAQAAATAEAAAAAAATKAAELERKKSEKERAAAEKAAAEAEAASKKAAATLQKEEAKAIAAAEAAAEKEAKKRAEEERKAKAEYNKGEPARLEAARLKAIHEKDYGERTLKINSEKIEECQDKIFTLKNNLNFKKKDLERENGYVKKIVNDISNLQINERNETELTKKEAIKQQISELQKRITNITTKISKINAEIEEITTQIAEHNKELIILINDREQISEILTKIGNNSNNSTSGGFRKRSKKYNNKNNNNKNNNKNNKTKTHKIKYINKHKKTNHKSKGKTSKK